VTNSELISDIHDKLTVTVEVAGKALNLGRNAAYEAVRRGDIPSVRIGRRYVIPTASLRRMLGIEGKEVA
jgi:excisionase family DNA binding protein